MPAVHVGSGLIGSKLPKFSIFGDSMNTASRMESTCVPGEPPSPYQKLKRIMDVLTVGGGGGAVANGMFPAYGSLAKLLPNGALLAHISLQSCTGMVADKNVIHAIVSSGPGAPDM